VLIVARLRTRLRDRRGFTLVETLVAMLTGIIVTGALFAILELSARQSSRLSNVAQATQVSRTAMTKIVDQLRSACLSTNFTPVVEQSTTSKLIFVNGYSKASEKEEAQAELAAGAIHKDEIEWNKETGKLIDKTYVATSNVPTETAQKYTWGTAKSTLLAENVSQVEEAGKKQPIFEYFNYNTKSQTETGKAASTLAETSLIEEGGKLTEAQAASVAAVGVKFRTAPPNKKEYVQNSTVEKKTFADQTSQTIFAFSAPNSEATIEAKPCE
jgi:Tfp pilus assembly protein PilW